MREKRVAAFPFRLNPALPSPKTKESLPNCGTVQHMRRLSPLCVALGCFVLAVPAMAGQTPAHFRDQEAKFRRDNERELTKKDGWLSVAGLYWLKDGDSVDFGLDAKGHPLLPCSSGLKGGSFVRSGDQVSLSETSRLLLNGKAPKNGTLAFDKDKVSMGSVTMIVIRRGARIGIRTYDNASEARKKFRGEKWFPASLAFRIRAKYTAYDKPKSMPITNVLGDTQPVPNPGFVEFTVRGVRCRLEAEDAGRGLFFNFKDLTTGKSTYPAGRFLDTDKPVNGFVTLDFNQATNPPCAFTPFATCPLPPAANALKVEIKAGEKTHHPGAIGFVQPLVN
jgi:uncharacterized protein (DUF1684 family)